MGTAIILATSLVIGLLSFVTGSFFRNRDYAWALGGCAVIIAAFDIGYYFLT